MPADEQQTRVLQAADDQPVSAEEQPAAADSPGARWATGTPDEPAAHEAPKDADATVAPAEGASTDEPTATAAPTEAAPTDQTTASVPQRLPVRDLPAGLDPGELISAPAGSARRGKLRRRLRYLRHVRELLLRDLGGFNYEVHRTAGGTPQEGHRKLAEAKANRIAALDAEVGAIEARLGEAHAETVLREPGIGGNCPECGELFASDAHFCSRCGLPLDAKARAQREASVAAAAAQPTPEPQPASVLWAGGPRPAAASEPEEKAQPSEVTSQWLLGRDQPTTADRAARPDERGGADEPSVDKPAPANEPSAGNEPATPNEAATGNEPTAANEPATANDPPAEERSSRSATDEPAPSADQPGADAAPTTAPDEAASGSAGDQPDRRFEPGPNGRRDDDVPSPVTGDPLTSRRGDQAP